MSNNYTYNQAANQYESAEPEGHAREWEAIFNEDYEEGKYFDIIKENLGIEVLKNMAYQIIAEDEHLQAEIEKEDL